MLLGGTPGAVTFLGSWGGNAPGGLHSWGVSPEGNVPGRMLGRGVPQGAMLLEGSGALPGRSFMPRPPTPARGPTELFGSH